MSKHKGRQGAVISSYFDVSREKPKGIDVYKEGSISLLGQIERIHFVDDDTNVSKEFVEYDVSVRDAYGGQSTFRNVRNTSGIAGGLNDFDEIVLEANEVAVKGELATSNFFKNKNGTLVIVEFINNSLDKPYISSVIGHPSVPSATREDGVRRKGEFRGLAWEITKQGAFSLTYQGNRTPDGKLEREDTGPTKFNVDENGNFDFSNNEDQTVSINRVDKKIIVSDSVNTVTMEKETSKVIVDADGSSIEVDGQGEKATVTIGGTTIEMDNSANKITLTAGSTIINIDGATGKIELTGSLVDVGEAASALAALGPQLLAWLSTHTHLYSPGPGGPTPSAPPTVPPPASLLSTSVKVKS